jgi:hypothetical protein
MVIAPGVGPWDVVAAAGTVEWVLWCPTCVSRHDRDLERACVEAQAVTQLSLFDPPEPATNNGPGDAATGLDGGSGLGGGR